MALDRFRKSGHRPDFAFIGFLLILLCIGLLMILSASVVTAYQNYDNNYYFVSKQVNAIIFGGILFLITANIDYHRYKKYALVVFFLSIILTALVLIPGIGVSVNGAQRWLDIGFIRFQSSEILKLGVVIYLAQWLSTKKKEIDYPSNFGAFLVILATISILVIAQRDLGTALVVSGIAVFLYFLVGGGLHYLAVIFGLAIVSVMLLIRFESYRMARFLVFLDPSQETLGAGYHINQALLAIGSGGLWGLGFGNSKQKYLYLPEPYTDSIFAIMNEELGFIRIIIFLLIFSFFIIKGFTIAKKAPDDFGKLLCSGIMIWITIQAILNIAAMLGIVPLTGVPLPLISYGGTSLVILLTALGIVVNISKFSIRETKENYERAK